VTYVYGLSDIAYIVRPTPLDIPSPQCNLASPTTAVTNERLSQETVYMQTLQAPRDSMRDVSSKGYIPEPWNVELSVRDAREQTASRHDEQALTPRIVPADPYAAWLAQREPQRSSAAVPV
jgi:hypothetical protein